MVVCTLALSLVIIVALGTVVNLVLGDRLRSDLQQRLVDRAHYAGVLATKGLSGQQLADELTGQGIAVSVRSGGSTYLGLEPPSRVTTTVPATPTGSSQSSTPAVGTSALVPTSAPVPTGTGTAVQGLAAQPAIYAATPSYPRTDPSTDPSSTRRRTGGGFFPPRTSRSATTSSSSVSVAATSSSPIKASATPSAVHSQASTTAAAPSTPAAPTSAAPTHASPLATPSTPPVPVTLTRTGSDLSAQVTYGATNILLTASEIEIDRTLSMLRTIEIIVGAVTLLLAAGMSVSLTRHALSPLSRMTLLAGQIRAGDRGRRLRPNKTDTDLGRMATSIDQMLDALESAELEAQGSEHRMRQFLADASHDLRTPLAVMMAEAEQLLRSDPGRAQREKRLVGVIREGRRAARLVDDVLLMARLDDPDPSAALRDEEIDLRELVSHAGGQMRMTRPERDVSLVLPPWPVPVRGDPDRLTRALTNLLDNARNATRVGGQVYISLTVRASRAVIDVIDDGPGIPPAEAERVFDRFVRLDEARRGTGSGLGLPIARAVARGHGGELSYLSDCPGAHFQLVVPLAPPPRSGRPRHARIEDEVPVRPAAPVPAADPATHDTAPLPIIDPTHAMQP